MFCIAKVEPGRSVRLRADMKLPGTGWLQSDARPLAEDFTRLVQVVFYTLWGLLGLLYWYMLYHLLILPGLLREFARLAERMKVGDKASTFPMKDQDDWEREAQRETRELVARDKIGCPVHLWTAAAVCKPGGVRRDRRFLTNRVCHTASYQEVCESCSKR